MANGRIHTQQCSGSDFQVGGRKLGEMPNIAFVQPGAFFDLHRIERIVFLENDIDFARLVFLGPKIEDGWFDATTCVTLEDFREATRKRNRWLREMPIRVHV